MSTLNTALEVLMPPSSVLYVSPKFVSPGFVNTHQWARAVSLHTALVIQ